MTGGSFKGIDNGASLGGFTVQTDGLYGGWPFAVCTNLDTLRIELDKWETPSFFLAGGLRPLDPSLGGRAGDPLSAHLFFSFFYAHILHVVFCHFSKVYNPRGASPRFCREI